MPELFVDGTFTENREEWQRQLQRHCKSVYTDPEETEEVQQETIEFFKTKGDRHFSEDGRAVEISVDLVLQVRVKLSDNKVSGPADAIVNEMINALLLEKIYVVAKFFQQRFMGAMEAPNSWKIVKLVFLRKPEAEPRKGIKGYQAIALTSVMSKWYASCVMMLVEREPVPEVWNRLVVGGINNRSCQHLQVMMTNLLPKHWEWQENREPMKKHGCVVRPTIFRASFDIMTAFDDARPKHVANKTEKQSIHGWLMSALLRKMSELQGRAIFEEVDTSSDSNRCLRQGSTEASKLWQMISMQILSEVEERWKEGRMGLLLDFKDEKDHQICSVMWADNVWLMSHSKKSLDEMVQDIIEEAGRWDLLPKAASLWWTSTYEGEEKIHMNVITKVRIFWFPFEEKFQDPGVMNRQGKTVDTRRFGKISRFSRTTSRERSSADDWWVMFTQLVGHVYPVFCFGSENGSWTVETKEQDQKMGDQDYDDDFPLCEKEGRYLMQDVAELSERYGYTWVSPF